ncbi:MAG: hypothetical protein KH282_04515 [Clostridiales bacterium]|nr:hypothetical protein [Clostridiales bacterium]
MNSKEENKMKNIPQNPNILYSFVRAKLHDGREKNRRFAVRFLQETAEPFCPADVALIYPRTVLARRSAAFRESDFKCFCFLSFFIISIEKPS